MTALIPFGGLVYLPAARAILDHLRRAGFIRAPEAD